MKTWLERAVVRVASQEQPGCRGRMQQCGAWSRDRHAASSPFVRDQLVIVKLVVWRECPVDAGAGLDLARKLLFQRKGFFQGLMRTIVQLATCVLWYEDAVGILLSPVRNRSCLASRRVRLETLRPLWFCPLGRVQDG